MRGNLVLNKTNLGKNNYEDFPVHKVEFWEDENGEYEVVDGGRITQHQQRINPKDFEKSCNDWQDELLSEKAKQSQPEDNPDWTKDAEWFITAFRHHGEIYACKYGYLPDGYEIWSVKRNSDNEEFTIGDEVYYSDFKDRSWVIDNFIVRGDGFLMARNKDNQMVEYVNNALTKKKEKEIIFTDEVVAELVCSLFNRLFDSDGIKSFIVEDEIKKFKEEKMKP